MDEYNIGGLKPPSIISSNADCSTSGEEAKISKLSTNTACAISLMNSLILLSNAKAATNTSVNLVGDQQSNGGVPERSVTTMQPSAALDVGLGISQGT